MAQRTTDAGGSLSADPATLRARMARTRAALEHDLDRLKDRLLGASGSAPKRGGSTVATKNAKPAARKATATKTAARKSTAKKDTGKKKAAGTATKVMKKVTKKATQVLGDALAGAASGALHGAAEAVAEDLGAGNRKGKNKSGK